ncbi:mannitol dehydrogenase family protein [Cellulomonas cellasea]|uniref:Mannitol-1-phosphate 5-dehydrogenase n=1 Tax=Cellulomonas cellasea TaxID=43670 RepID=A0A7W4UHQ2_9CELL|nr:mannitol dehydrogenase family protein [Cellulomonas cellasea]MBB2924375.1 fructuronate reductase [Cellulomonas cellasea]
MSTPTGTAPVLSRAGGHGRPAAPVRIVHLGLGNFFRAHQAWYTDHAPDADAWGIAAFTGRSAAAAEALAPQDGLYTLVTRAADGDSFEVVSSVSAVHAATDHEAWLGYWAAPETAVVTLTVTEAGYLRADDGGLDVTRDDVRADVSALGGDPRAVVATTPGRIVAGYLARRAAGAGPIAVLPCDNLPENGPALQRVVDDLIDAVDPSLAAWAEENVAFGTTMVDRITPATTDENRDAVRAALGVEDASPVPTEPFSEWVVAGRFPNGRPAWEAAGVTLVDDVLPFEQRKLWLLNGAHSLLAYAGSARGHETVADAVADPVLRRWVEDWWDEAARHLTLPAEDVADYRHALVERFTNPRIRHVLAQIAGDGSQKIGVRIVPTLRAELAAGRVPTGAARAVAAWTCHLRGLGAPVKDARADHVRALGQGSLAESVDAVLGFLGADLAGDDGLRAAVLAAAEELTAGADRP